MLISTDSAGNDIFKTAIKQMFKKIKFVQNSIQLIQS